MHKLTSRIVAEAIIVSWAFIHYLKPDNFLEKKKKKKKNKLTSAFDNPTRIDML